MMFYKLTVFFCPPVVGKTTLADSLVASNGIISHRQAGKVSSSKYSANCEQTSRRTGKEIS